MRSAIASIAPISVYSVGFGAAKLAGVSTGLYFAATPWIAIGALSVIYPINTLSLAALFKPIEWMLISKLKKNQTFAPENNPALIGNFASCKKEDSYEVLDILEGQVPTDINGVYLRNGPNFKYMPETDHVHWFDGDSMIHSFRIKDGKIFYCNRYTQTPKLEIETQEGKAIFPRFGDITGTTGLMKVGLFALQQRIGYAHFLPQYKQGAANTAFCHHQQKTFALLEGDFPFHIMIDRSEKEFDIKSIGFDDFGG